MLSFLLGVLLLQGRIGAPPSRVTAADDQWRFRTGDSVAYADPRFDDSEWRFMAVPGSWGRHGYRGYRGFAWYRTRLVIGQLPAAPLGIQLRSVAAAYEVYLDGARLGGVGGFPPEYRPRTGVPLTLAVPVGSLGPGSHVLAVRVYSEGAHGGLVGSVSVGPLRELLAESARNDLYLFATALLLLGIGLYQVFFWAGRPLAREHLLIFLSSAALALFFLNWTGAARLAIAPWFNWFRFYVALGSLAAAAFCFGFRRVFDLDDDRVVRAFGLIFLALVPVSFVLPTQDMLRFVSAYLLNPVLLVASTTILVVAVTQWRVGVGHARPLMWGAGILVATLLHDVSVDWGWISLRAGFPFLIHIGALAFVASLAATTARKFVDTQTTALYDHLTGLYRREVVMDGLNREIRRAARMKQPLAVIMMDLDRFKSVNDSLGHQAGDRVLSEVGRRLAEGGRAVDWLGRYGGEEFLAVLAASSAGGAAQAAERFRQAVGALPIDVGRTSRTVTLSAGVAAYDGGEEWPTAEQLVGAADTALYRAKENGRNQVMTV